ncbi:hypothetical protein [Rosistilla oblonga]|uniref:hypothetical protein n=1 Tax=Rosistilla oblonga TaxID=2527990 RepID=UPI003A975AB3
MRDNEGVPLTVETARGANVDAAGDAYYREEGASDSWHDGGKCDAKDEQVGIVGYEIPFNRHFYGDAPPQTVVREQVTTTKQPTLSGRALQ